MADASEETTLSTVAPGSDAGSTTNDTTVAPVTTDTTTVAPQLSAEEQDDAEWDDIENEMFPGSTTKQDKKDEQAKSETTTTTTTADPKNPTGEKSNEEQGAGDDTAKGGEQAKTTTETTTADSQPSVGQSARDYARQVETVRADVIKQMFADVPETLQDADGDPIKSIEDVMKLQNPRTNEAFTEEEAGMWLLSAQQKFNQQRSDMEKQATQIAEVQIEIKEQADRINTKYGAYLKANEKLRDDLWTEWQETLIKDEKSGVITKTPMSLERFYERALGPIVESANATAAAAEKAEADKKAADELAKKEADEKKKNNRADRSDIYGGGNKLDTRDDDDKEWDEAESAVFGNRK